MVDEEETSGEDKGRRSARSSGINGSNSPTAMDIDTPPPEPSAVQADGPRNIHVEPTKPEWRAGHVNVNGGNAEPKLGTGLKMPNLNPNAAGSEDTEEFMRPIFSEFQNVEPFMQKPAGLGSFADLSANLPFPSRPSPKIPVAHEKPRPLDFPPVPVAPRVPPALCTPGPACKPSSPEWLNYHREFSAYLAQWFEFKRKVTDHFAARQRLDESNGLAWVNARGDGAALEYLRSMETDKYVRVRWGEASDVHEADVRGFLAVKERVVGAG